jgi:hypothetical protein
MSDLRQVRRERDAARQLVGLHRRRERVLTRFLADLTRIAVHEHKRCRCTVCQALRQLEHETAHDQRKAAKH